MPQLTEELWNKLWKAQEEREAQQREKIRQAVAVSKAPLPAELVQAIIPLHDRDARLILREHPGFRLAERRDSYLTSLAIMEECLQDLLSAIGSFESAVFVEGSQIFNRNNEATLRAIERHIQKELFATANAAASLVDHSRRIQKLDVIPNYHIQRLACFGADGLHTFVIALRVMLHHLHVIDAGWNVQTRFAEGTKFATFTINKPTIQRVIADSPERFGGAAEEPMRAYVEASSENMDLRAIFLDYRDRTMKFHGWMKNELASETLIALRDYDRILREKSNFGKRLFWKAMIGNWLNSKPSPDPHKHLSKYLTSAQLEAVYELPRNSKAQVNLVISYMDRDNAIDDELRARAYELFERSPPSDSPPLLNSA